MKYKFHSVAMLLSVIVAVLYQSPTMASIVRDVKIKRVNTPDKKDNFTENAVKKTQDGEIKVLQMKSENGGNNIVINVITKGKDSHDNANAPAVNENKNDNAKSSAKKNKKTNVGGGRRIFTRKSKKNNQDKQKIIRTEPLKEQKNNEIIQNKSTEIIKNDNPDTEEIEYIVKEEYVDENGKVIESKMRPATQEEVNNEKSEEQKLSVNKPSFEKE